ncbi:MAG: hypothetical protein AB7N76_05655 [Planctomycetota bacterium]
MLRPGLLLLALLCTGCPRGAGEQRAQTAPPARSGGGDAFSQPQAQAQQVQTPAQAPATKPKAKPTPRAQVLAGVGPVTAIDDLPTGTFADLPRGECATGQLERADDVDRFRVSARAGETVRVRAHSCGEVTLRLRARDGRELAAGSGRVEHRAARAEDLVLEVAPVAGQGLFYALERE